MSIGEFCSRDVVIVHKGANALEAAKLMRQHHVGDVVGTSADRPADDLAGNGDPTQMDCVDVATNLTSYLLILERAANYHEC